MSKPGDYRAYRQSATVALMAGLFISATTLTVKAADPADRLDIPSETQSITTEFTPSPIQTIAPIGHVYRVSGSETPSGFQVPRFVSLKFGKVNARTGPSRNHSIAYQYQRRGLPLVVVAETEMWRKVRDIQGDEAWVRKPALSGDRYAVVTETTRLTRKPTEQARTLANIEKGALVKLGECSDDGYCRVQTRHGVKGFAPRRNLWGAQAIN